jgi:hypothetical protein
MADPFTEFMREGYPKESINSEGYQTILEYIGERDVLYNTVEKGKPWGDWQGVVEDVTGEVHTGTVPLLATLTVRMMRRFGDEPEIAQQQGQEQETRFEIDWVDVTRPFIDHPAFATDGEYALGVSERLECLKWEEMDVPEFKKEYMYYPGRYSDWQGAEGDLLLLSGTNAEKYADGRLLGIEYFVEKVPVLRKSTTYVDGVPPQAGAGKKENPSDFPPGLKPEGYEYIRNADRSINNGKQNEWQRDQEWLGAKVILIDSQNIYY